MQEPIRFDVTAVHLFFDLDSMVASPKNDAYLGSQIIECDQRLNFKYPWKKFLFCILHSAF